MSELDWGALQKEAKEAGVYADGDYNIIIFEAAATTSSNGKPMIKVKARITDGPKKDKPVYNQFVVSPESGMALRIFFQHMAAFGLDANFFAQNPSMDVVAKNLMNRGAVFTLETGEWKGQARNNVAGVKPLPAGGPLIPGLVVGPPSVGPTGMSPVSATPASTPTTPNSPAVVSTPVNTPGAPPTTPF